MEIDGGGGGVFLLLTKQPTFRTTKLTHHNPLVLRLCKFKTTHDSNHYSFCSRHCSNPYHYYNNTLTSSGNSYVGIIGTVTSTVRCGRWDSNAEASGPRRFKFKYRDKNRTGSSRNDGVEGGEGGGQGSFTRRRKRKWLSSDPPRREAQEEIGFWDEVIDGLWILKVFRSYGFTLFPIIIALILATGPGAFLSVFAICLGQSALIYAIEKLLGRRQREPKRKVRRKERPSSRTSPYTWVDDEDQEQEEEEEEEEGKEEWTKENMGYQSWVVDENGSVSKDDENAPQFGGWDDIDGLGSVPRPAQTAGRQRKTPSENGKVSETGRESGMFTKTGRESDTPLLLRLLIAVFPFLGSWTKMFW